jgi:hypothetical protein
MEENLQNVRKTSTLSLASVVFASASAICLIAVSFYALSIQYTHGFQTARSAIIAASVAFFATELLALVLGLIALRRAYSSKSAATDKVDSLFGIISSVIYLGIAIFFLPQITG